MCYRKDFWKQIRFPAVAEGEDTRFAWADRASTILPLCDPSIDVPTVYPRNTSPKQTSDARWRSCPVPAIRDLPGEDWPFYLNWVSLGVQDATHGAVVNSGFPGGDLHGFSQENLGGIAVNVS